MVMEHPFVSTIQETNEGDAITFGRGRLYSPVIPYLGLLLATK